MFRRYDWECQRCFSRFERIVQYPEGRARPSVLSDVEHDPEELTCPFCTGDARDAECLMSAPAEYHGERDLSPCVAGGRFDTMGHKQVERPGDVGFLPDNASYEQARDFVRRPIFREWKNEKMAVKAENEEKRKRAAAKARGENINFRRDKCAGDPKIAS